MTRFYFIRHGERARQEKLAGSRPRDPGLSDEGMSQAIATAERLRSARIERIHAGPLRRASQTASLIAARLGLEARADPRLRERANFGDLPGQSFAEFERMWERASRDRSWAPEIGDSSLDAGRRVERFVEELAAESSGNVAAVTHGGVLSDFLLNAFDADALAEKSAEFARNPYDGRVMRECAVTVVRLDRGRLQLEDLASLDHLRAT